MTATVGIIMGSQSDWPTMRAAADILFELEVPHETAIVSAHRTPDRLWEYGRTAVDRGLQVIIAGAGGAAHLPGMMASKTVNICLARLVPESYATTNTQRDMHSRMEMVSGSP